MALSAAARTLLALILAGLVWGPSARAADRIFFAVQFAVLQDLEAVNRQVNALQDKGKLVFWEKTTMPGAEPFYRVYLGRFHSWDEALAYAERLKHNGEVQTYGIHWFAEPEPGPVNAPPEIRGRIRLAPLKTVLSEPKDRFVDNGDGTITDAATGLMWPQNGWRLDLLSALPWDQAIGKVSEFRLAGYSDWRLPTIEEWLSLIDAENRNPALVSPNPFVNIISHMPYWSATEYTYGRDRTCLKECPLESYTVMLYTGNVNHQKKSELAFVLPVRSAGKR